jgi:YegS/Rv2252/BmrU family lipid kinase
LKRLLVVTNASSGAAEEVQGALAVLRAAADVQVRACGSAEELPQILAELDGRQLVAAGGDGSLHVAVSALRAGGLLSPAEPLGLLPLGTGNDLARSLGVPLDPVQAAEALLAGRPRVLDLLVDDAGGVVVNAAHVGVGAEAAQQAGALKPRLGKAAYAVGSAVAGLTTDGWAVRVEVDGRVVHDGGPALMVGVCNGRTIGGGAELAPDAQVDDGLLDVVVATSTGPLARLGFGVRLRDGRHVERDDVTAARGRTVTVTGEDLPVNCDGELQGPVSRRTWTVQPGAWAVLV